MSTFTKEELIKAASEKYGRPISTDLLDDAMSVLTLEEAIEILIVDSVYWDTDFYDLW